MKIWGIYLITNPLGQIYIGLSEDIEARWKTYYYACNIKSQKLLYRSIKKFGRDNHKLEILEICTCDRMVLGEREKFWIKAKHSYYYNNKEFGLNLTEGGNIPNKQNKPHSKEHNAKISLAKKGKKHSLETKEKISKALFGKKQSEETVRKRALALTGRVSKLKNRKRPNISKKLKGKISSSRIKCKLINILTGEVIEADSVTELLRISGLHAETLYKIKANSIKKYKHYKYEEDKKIQCKHN
jgi:group I intron endonuclease